MLVRTRTLARVELYSTTGASGSFCSSEVWQIGVLGHVTIIVYGCSSHMYSLFQDVLKRSGTFRNVVKFSQIGQDSKTHCMHSSSGYTIDIAMHRALKRYRCTIPAPKKCQIVGLLACVHCVYIVRTVCVHCVHQILVPILANFCRLVHEKRRRL
jgi:hypothetical protein